MYNKMVYDLAIEENQTLYVLCANSIFAIG
jgi:hypothetical protein